MRDDNSTPETARSESRPTTKTRAVGPKASRAIRLIEQAIARDLATPEGLARALGVSVGRLEEYRRGQIRMPLESQRHLAEVILHQVPELARDANRLQLQCKAAEAFAAKETATHLIAPPNRFR